MSDLTSMTGPSYEWALADAGVTLEDLTRRQTNVRHNEENLRYLVSLLMPGTGGSRPHTEILTNDVLWLIADLREARQDRDYLHTALLAGCREADDQRARADKAVVEAKALRVERDEALKPRSFSEDRAMDLFQACSEIAEVFGIDLPLYPSEQLVPLVRQFKLRADRAEATLAEAQRQAAEAERAGMEPVRHMDQCDAARQGHDWIDGLIQKLGRLRAFCHIDEGTLFEKDGCFRVLWYNSQPYAMFVVLRDDRNFSVLFRWLALAPPSAPGSVETEGDKP